MQSRLTSPPVAYDFGATAGLLAMHGFFLFMIVSGTVVFEDGLARMAGLAVTIVGALGLWLAVRRPGVES